MSSSTIRAGLLAALIGTGLVATHPIPSFADQLPQFDAKQVTILQTAPKVINAAIKAAERSVKGQALEAIAVEKAGAPTYVIEVMSGQKVQSISVDGKTGKVIATTEKAPAVGAAAADSASEHAAFAKAKVGLRHAINIAEQAAKGRALAGAFHAGKNGQLVFEVEVALKDHSVKTISIDGLTGKVLEKMASLSPAIVCAPRQRPLIRVLV